MFLPIRRLSASFVFILCSILFLSAAASAQPVGKIVSLSGDARVLRGEAGQALNLQMLSPVHAGDIVETEAKSVAVIRFEDQSTLTVGAASRIAIDQYVYNPQSPAQNGALLDVKQGFFQFVSGKMRRDRLEIRTPVSTIGIRGTEFYGEVRPDGTTWVGLVECCVVLESQAGQVTLERVGTYSEVAGETYAPTQPALAPYYWVQAVAEKLGSTTETLGVPKPQPEGDDSQADRFNRTSFPYID